MNYGEKVWKKKFESFFFWESNKKKVDDFLFSDLDRFDEVNPFFFFFDELKWFRFGYFFVCFDLDFQFSIFPLRSSSILLTGLIVRKKKETKLCRSKKKKILGLRHNFLRCLIFFFFFFRSDSIDDRNRFSVSNEKQKKIVKHPVEVAPIRKAFTIFNPDGPESQISFTLIACAVFCFNQSLPVIALVFDLISFAKQFDWFAFFCFVHHFFFRQDQRKNFHLSPNDRSVIWFQWIGGKKSSLRMNIEWMNSKWPNFNTKKRLKNGHDWSES